MSTSMCIREKNEGTRFPANTRSYSFLGLGQGSCVMCWYCTRHALARMELNCDYAPPLAVSRDEMNENAFKGTNLSLS